MISPYEIIKYLTSVDRYQWSKSIELTCEYLQSEINRIREHGLSRVIKLDSEAITPALGFSAPKRWGLEYGAANFSVSNNTILSLNWKSNPLLVGTNSEPCDGSFVLTKNARGSGRPSFFLHDADETSWEAALNVADKNASIHGIITAQSSKHLLGAACRRRIELHGHATTVINLTPTEMAKLLSLYSKGITADIVVKTEQDGQFSILEYCVNQELEDGRPEIWLCAHICHPRPGANDNASGIATLFEIIKLIERFKYITLLPTIKVIMAAEFTGMTQYLALADRIPDFVVNIDCVGAADFSAGKELVVEMPPSFMSSARSKDFLLHILEQAKTECPFEIESVPFKGYSDHALFAASCIDVPAVMVAQELDKYNHTDLDKIENIDFSKIQWLANAIFGFLVKTSAHKKVQKKVTLHFGNKLKYPFNFFGFLALLSAGQALFIKKQFRANKATYAYLQLAWLMAGRGFSDSEIIEVLSTEMATDHAFTPQYLESLLRSAMHQLE